jgi:hypothetical protein
LQSEHIHKDTRAPTDYTFVSFTEPSTTRTTHTTVDYYDQSSTSTQPTTNHHTHNLQWPPSPTTSPPWLHQTCLLARARHQRVLCHQCLRNRLQRHATTSLVQPSRASTGIWRYPQHRYQLVSLLEPPYPQHLNTDLHRHRNAQSSGAPPVMQRLVRRNLRCVSRITTLSLT